jgi:hypothetical protein
MALHAPWILVIEAGPAAARLEFSLGGKERIVAAPANKNAGRKQRIVFSAERPFGSLVDYDSLFLS